MIDTRILSSWFPSQGHGLRERLGQNLLSHANDTAIIFFSNQNEQRVSYRELLSLAVGYATFLKSQGLKNGDVVFFILPQSVDLIAWFWAVVILGAIPSIFTVPSHKQNKEYYIKQLRTILQESGCKMLIQDYDLEIDLKDMMIISVGAIDKNIIYNSVEVAQQTGELDVCILQYSSGTTGIRKGVILGEKTVLKHVDCYGNMIGFSSGSKIASWLPLYHDMGLIAAMVMPLCRAGQIIMMDPFLWSRHPELFIQKIIQHGCQYVWMPNFAFAHTQGRFTKDELAKNVLKDVRWISCSEPIDIKVANNFIDHFSFAGATFSSYTTCYAMAEATFAVSQSSQNQSLKVMYLNLSTGQFLKILPKNELGWIPIVSSGKLLDGVTVKIDKIEGVPFDYGVGEICIKSEFLAQGYWRNPSDTQGAFKEGWFYSRDIGFISGDELYVVGRNDDTLVINGINIFAPAIDAMITGMPDSIPGRSVAFAHLDDATNTKRLVILIETRSPVSDYLNIKSKYSQALRSVLEVDPYVQMVPHMSLHKSSSGKISRRRNYQAWLDGFFNVSAHEKASQSL
ncbi:MAG: AMP-binding protein [Deltaproteobacteria bacterium]|nr:AMP-binding protein [Deltaproteobacteria bacterium]